MKNLILLSAFLTAMVAGCSLPPERPVYKQQLYDSGIYNVYTIRDSPESVLAALNREGEVVLDVKYKDRPVYVKILATRTGLLVSIIER